MTKRASRGAVWRAIASTLFVSALVAVLAYSSIDSHAQGAAAQRPAPAASGNTSGDEFISVWSNQGATGRCTPNGQTCPFVVTEVPLNARGVAHWQVFDEALAPKYDCVEATTPGILPDPYNFEIQRFPDRIVLRYEKDDVSRTAWLDGRKPGVNEFTWQGHSTARFEGKYLVVETTNFLYDPIGLDDQGGLASSHQKKVTERYWRDGDFLRAEVITEDPLFLVAPARFDTVWRVAPAGTKLQIFECDPGNASHPLKYIPKKYPDGRAKIPDVTVGPPVYRGLGEQK